MQYKDIVDKKEYFREITWCHLSNCIKAFESAELMSASVWAAVFVESLLKDILSILLDENKLSKDEMSSLINLLRNTLNNKNSTKASFSDDDLLAIEDIIRRSDEIRLKRNRLVHDTGVENINLDSDAHDIYTNVETIVRRYTQSIVGDIMRKQRIVPVEPAVHADPKFPMFLSTITPHTFEQSEFIESFCNELRKIGINPIRCTLTDFDRRNPMEKVRKCIERSNGIIVLGLERTHSYFYKDKEGSSNEFESIHRRYSSAWLQLETGIAIGMDKDVFVVCQKDLYGDGIFDRNWNSYSPVELDIPLDINDPKIKYILHALECFKEEFEKNQSH